MTENQEYKLELIGKTLLLLVEKLEMNEPIGADLWKSLQALRAEFGPGPKFLPPAQSRRVD